MILRTSQIYWFSHSFKYFKNDVHTICYLFDLFAMNEMVVVSVWCGGVWFLGSVLSSMLCVHLVAEHNNNNLANAVWEAVNAFNSFLHSSSGCCCCCFCRSTRWAKFTIFGRQIEHCRRLIYGYEKLKPTFSYINFVLGPVFYACWMPNTRFKYRKTPFKIIIMESHVHATEQY